MGGLPSGSISLGGGTGAVESEREREHVVVFRYQRASLRPSVSRARRSISLSLLLLVSICGRKERPTAATPFPPSFSFISSPPPSLVASVPLEIALEMSISLSLCAALPKFHVLQTEDKRKKKIPIWHKKNRKNRLLQFRGPVQSIDREKCLLWFS